MGENWETKSSEWLWHFFKYSIIILENLTNSPISSLGLDFLCDIHEVRRNFPGGQHRHFAYPYQVSVQMDVYKTLWKLLVQISSGGQMSVLPQCERPWWCLDLEVLNQVSVSEDTVFFTLYLAKFLLKVRERGTYTLRADEIERHTQISSVFRRELRQLNCVRSYFEK